LRRNSRRALITITTRTNKPLIIGHRGASAVAPENTLVAFKQALSAGADGIELDVRLARDGVPVVIHDATLRRTGLMAGSIGQLDSKQLAQVDVGTWFNRANPNFARSEFARECVPTLAKVFELLRNKQAVIYVEMKSEHDDSSVDLARAVAALIEAFKFHERVVVVSFDLAAIANLKTLDSSIRTGGLFGSSRSRQWRTENILAAAAECGVDELLLHRLLVRKQIVKEAEVRKLPIVVWTVDQPEWTARASTNSFGLHALITNEPARMLKHIRQLI
jgi:glycerophosphoryl diester phosphodiesterase